MTNAPETELLAQALGAGLVTAREARDGDVSLQRMAGDARRYAVLVHGHPIAQVKLADEPVTRERRTLRLLAGTGLAPQEIAVEDDRALWTGAERGTALADVTTSMAELVEVCRLWGAATAALHGAATGTLDPALVAPRPWVLDPARLPAAMRRAPANGARALVLRTLGGDRALARTVERAADRWTARPWIHGNRTEDRVRLHRSPELRLTFGDFADGGLGDPGWDLAAALETIEALTAPGGRWAGASADCLTEYFVHGYRRAGGPATLDPGLRALRTLARAWALAERLDAATPHPLTLHPSVADPARASRLTERLAHARGLAARSARPGLLAA